MVEGTVERGGIRWLNVEILRNRLDGKVVFSFRADPRIEEYFKNISKGRVGTVAEIYGSGCTEWQPIEGEFTTYYVGHDSFDSQSSFFFGAPGRSFRIESNPDRDGRDRDDPLREAINLSFLHLKGVSDEKGITFSLKVPMSYSEMKRLKVKFEAAVGEFVKEYLTNVRIVLQISSFEAP